MTSLIFVHGTGVREPEYTITFNHIKNPLQQNLPHLRVLPCSWGDNVGAAFHYDGKSVPFFDTTMAIGDDAFDDADVLRMLWELLYQDPLYELRSLTLGSPADSAPVPGQLPPGEALDTQVQQLPTAALIQSLFPEITTPQHFRQALETVTNTALYQQLIAHGDDAATLAPALARA